MSFLSASRTILGCFLLIVGCFSASAASQQCKQSYSLEIKTHTQFSFGQSNRSYHILRANMALKQFAASDTGSWFGLQLTEVEQKLDNQVLQQEPILSLPFKFHRTYAGQIDQFQFSQNLTKEQQDRLKGLAFYLQFTDKKSQQQLSVQEVDTIGELTAEYSWQAPVLIKRKQAYINLANASTVSQPIEKFEVIKSKHQITPDDCLVERILGSETLLATGKNKQLSMQTQQTYRLFKLEKLTNADLFFLTADINTWPKLVEPEKHLTTDELAKLRKQMLSQLAYLDLAQIDTADLANWLLQFDPVLDSLHQLIMEQKFSDAANMRLFNALGLLDSVNSQSLLIGIIETDLFSENNRFRALRALSQGQKALTADITERLVVLLGEQDFAGSEAMHGATIMTLGALVARRQNNEHSQTLETALTNKLAGETNSRKQAALVASLGNTANEKHTDTLAKYTQVQSDHVRANAAFSLGQIGGEKAHNLLSGMLQAESSDRVHKALFSALGNFSMNSAEIDKVSELAVNSSSEQTRAAAIKALAKQTQQKQQVTTHLKQMMKSEKSRKNFALAAKSLVALDK
ncbi:HEAT repeat domain-containing protein [Catenovulum agarivorans]|uniref:HEAT repeat domain-containing protein n=1 Tax=Catenovulum agarivorans TaxID=1172192 RepID=UPI0002E18407|nr:HEAT repeat domain-containing protein [Catenovulum agarivorans]